MSWQRTNDKILAVCVVLLCCTTVSLALMEFSSMYVGHPVWPLVVSTISLAVGSVVCLVVGAVQLFFSTMSE